MSMKRSLYAIRYNANIFITILITVAIILLHEDWIFYLAGIVFIHLEVRLSRPAEEGEPHRQM